MKRIILLVTLFSIGISYGQNSEITPDNSWLKIGLNIAAPVGDTSDFSSFVLGADLRGQFLVNPNLAIGVASGYSHFFAKDDFDDFGLIPLAAFGRYYFNESGWFIGVDLGYGFLTNVEDNSGGLYFNPQIGYNTYHWNVYGFYQHTNTENDFKVQAVGLGITYNVRFE